MNKKIKMTLFAINIIVLGWTSQGTLAKCKHNISNGDDAGEKFGKLDAKFVNGFLISAFLWLIIIALALFI